MSTLVEKAVAKFGRLDAAVNSAGIIIAPGPLHLVKKEDFEKTNQVREEKMKEKRRMKFITCIG